MAKLPAIQFYPGDWRKDMGVQSLSFHDRAVWFEMLLMMHDSEVRGKLIMGGKAVTEEVMAGVLRIDLETLKTTVQTLLDRGVTEREKRTGALINRRMLRDEKYRAEERVKMRSWRKSKKIKDSCNEYVIPVVTEMLPLSSSSSSSSSSVLKNKSTSGADVEIPSFVDMEVWEGFLEIRKRKKAPYTKLAIQGVVKDLIGFADKGHDPNDILRNSIKGGWQTVFEPRQNGFHQSQGVTKPITVAEKIARSLAQ